MEIEQQLIALLRLALKPENKFAISEVSFVEDWLQIIKYAKQHSLVSMVYYGISALPSEKKPPQDVLENLQKTFYQYLLISERQLYESKRILDTLESSGIVSMAVKGTVMKKRYPFSVMRSMGDIDLLYDHTSTKKVRSIMQGLGFALKNEERRHDFYEISPSICVEMHRNLVPENSPYASYFEDILCRSRVVAGYQYIHEMNIEDELIYSFLHLLEHFQNGGIGIRFIVDIYIYTHSQGIDLTYVKNKLDEWNLKTFFDNICNLSEEWFGEVKTNNKALKALSEFILHNKVFGTSQNKMDLIAGKIGSLRFLIKSAFPNYSEMVPSNSWLKHIPILLPIAWIIRACKTLLFSRGKISGQWKRATNGDFENGKRLAKLYKEFGL